MLFSKSDVGHPWQNGLSERTNQALKIIVKKLLIASGVPSEFWAYAMKYAATVRNITGVKVYNELQSPYNEVFGQGVDIQYFHPFGCKAYMVRNVIAQNLSNHHPATRLDGACDPVCVRRTTHVSSGTILVVWRSFGPAFTGIFTTFTVARRSSSAGTSRLQ